MKHWYKPQPTNFKHRIGNGSAPHSIFMKCIAVWKSCFRKPINNSMTNDTRDNRLTCCSERYRSTSRLSRFPLTLSPPSCPCSLLPAPCSLYSRPV